MNQNVHKPESACFCSALRAKIRVLLQSKGKGGWFKQDQKQASGSRRVAPYIILCKTLVKKTVLRIRKTLQLNEIPNGGCPNLPESVFQRVKGCWVVPLRPSWEGYPHSPYMVLCPRLAVEKDPARPMDATPREDSILGGGAPVFVTSPMHFLWRFLYSSRCVCRKLSVHKAMQMFDKPSWTHAKQTSATLLWWAHAPK